MPEMSAAKRGAGAWVAEGSLAPVTPLRTPAKPCGYFEGGDLCGALTERRYLPGHRCPRHTPAAIAGRPEDTPDPDQTVEALRSRTLRATADHARYGRAKDCPRLQADGITPMPAKPETKRTT